MQHSFSPFQSYIYIFVKKQSIAEDNPKMANVTALVPGTSDMSANERILMIVVTPFIIISAVMVNVPVIVTLVRSPKVHLHGQGILLSLVLSDLLFIFVAVPSAFAFILTGQPLVSKIPCQLQGFLICWLSTTSASNITVIGIARYWSIVHSAWYRGLQKYHLILLMLSAWVYAFFVILPSVTGWGRIEFSDRFDSCMMDWTYNSQYAIFLLVFSYLLPLFIILVCYTRIFVVFWKSRAKFKQQSLITNGKFSVKKSDFRLALQLLLLLSTYALCWGPFLVVSILIDRDGTMDGLVYDIVRPILGMSSMLNPMIYFFFNSAMKAEAKHLF